MIDSVPGTLLPPLARSACALLVLATITPAQTQHDQDVADYTKRKRNVLFQAAARHLDIGTWCRKLGLIPQATSEFLRAVEVGEGVHEGAVTVLNVMRSYGDAFWRGERKKPSEDLLRRHELRREAAEKETRRARTVLALEAATIRMDDEAKAQCLAVLRLGGASLEMSAGGVVKLEERALPKALGDWLSAQAIPVTGTSGTARVFEEAASKSELKDVAECATPELRVRTDLGIDAAKELHALCSALLPLLAARLDGRPTRRLGLFVFKTRAAYEGYLRAAGSEEWKAASGFADYGSFQTLVCAEGLAKDDLHALILHELSHLFFFGVAPAVMPDWYAEGFAEGFGGQGTFRWNGTKLTIGGKLREDRLTALKKSPMPLADLLAASAIEELRRDKEKGLHFYACSWALMRFLCEGKHEWRAKFDEWEARCRGTVVGMTPGQKRADALPARELFTKMFGKELAKLEPAFRAWLAGL